LADMNLNSEEVFPNVLIESGFDKVKRRALWPEAVGESELGKGGPESVRFQAMQIAYFVSWPPFTMAFRPGVVVPVVLVCEVNVSVGHGLGQYGG